MLNNPLTSCSRLLSQRSRFLHSIPRQRYSLRKQNPYPCSYELTCVTSAAKSQNDNRGEDGLAVVTHGVRDLITEDSREYTLTSNCTTDTRIDFILTPLNNWSSRLAALVVICGILDAKGSAEQLEENVLVESVLDLRDEEAATSKGSLMKLLSFIAVCGPNVHY